MKKILLFLALSFSLVGCQIKNSYIKVNQLKKCEEVTSDKEGKIFYNNKLIAYYDKICFECFKGECFLKIHINTLDNYQPDTLECLMTHVYYLHPKAKIEIEKIK